MQHRNACIWAEVDSAASANGGGRMIEFVGTGHACPAADSGAAYIGTVQYHGGDLVMHVYDLGYSSNGS